MTATPPGPDTFLLIHHYDRTFPLLNETTPTFLGVPAARTTADLANAGAAIIGIPYVIPEFPYGADLVPRHLHVASAKYRGGYLPELDLDPLVALNVVDYGDVEIDPLDVSASIERTRAKVAEVVAAGCIPITIGGNAPIAAFAPLAEVAAAIDGTLGVVNLDEHGDNVEAFRGESMHAFTWAARSLEQPNVPYQAWAQLGMRGPGNAREQHDWFRRKGAHLFTARDHQALGTPALVKRALDIAGAGTAATFLATDWDILDTSAAPGWSYPDPLGFTANDMLHLAYEIGRSQPPLAGCALMALPAWSRPTLWLACWTILYALAGVCARTGRHG